MVFYCMHLKYYSEKAPKGPQCKNNYNPIGLGTQYPKVWHFGMLSALNRRRLEGLRSKVSLNFSYSPVSDSTPPPAPTAKGSHRNQNSSSLYYHEIIPFCPVTFLQSCPFFMECKHKNRQFWLGGVSHAYNLSTLGG
ncbi:hypothetical protein EGK_20393 [Macaca mulatta]|uniref:Uncharacterized protein n=1 Tax=Macaca mulatta TaxID=9544 RepID=G7NT03_MACMU|nr:hypothetical protein EGK_20393 [Macaca mulatta]